MGLLEKYQKKMIDIKKVTPKMVLEDQQQYQQNYNQEEPQTEVTRQETEAKAQPELTPYALSQMPLSDFEKAKLCLKIRSEVLQQEVLFVSDERAIPEDLPEGGAVYTARELLALVAERVQPENLKLIHVAKIIFNNATITRGDKKR